MVFAAGADPESGAEQSARLFPLPMRDDGQGIFRGAIPLPPFLPAGSYLLQIQVTDDAAGEHRIFRLALEVLALPPPE